MTYVITYGIVKFLVDAWMPALRDKLALKTVNQMTTLPKWLKDLADREKINFSQVLQSGLKDRLGVYDHRHREKKQRV